MNTNAQRIAALVLAAVAWLPLQAGAINSPVTKATL